MKNKLLLLSGIVCTFFTARAQQINQNFWETDGEVKAVLSKPGKLYVGGSFSYIGPTTGSAGVVSTTNGQTLAGNLGISGMVMASVADASGNVYLGGDFKINGTQSATLVKVTSANTIDPAFSFAIDGKVTSLAINNNSLFAAGDFSFVNSQLRAGIAAIDLATNSLSSFAPNPDGKINTLASGNGNLYVGGSFSFISGSQRNSIAVYNGAKALQSLNISVQGSVSSLLVADSILIVAGKFDSIGGLGRVNLATVNVNTGNVRSWRADIQGSVNSMAAANSNVYLAGDFYQVGIESRNYLAAVNILNGAVQTFNPGMDMPVHAIAVKGSNIIAAGEFNAVGFDTRRYLTSVSMSTGNANGSLPLVNGPVHTFSLIGDNLCIGGEFSSFGGELRNNFAVLDPSTGLPLPLTLEVDGPVYDLESVGNDLLLAGDFMTVKQSFRKGIAIVDTATFTPVTWDIAADGPVYDALVLGNNIYLGGSFTALGTTSRNNLAVVNAFSGTAGSWDPNMNGAVKQLLLNQAQLYACGDFTQAATSTRKYVASFDLSNNGVLRSWSINPDTTVNAIETNGAVLFIGGKFTSIGSTSANYLAAVDTGNAAVTSFLPVTGGEVNAINEMSGLLFAGGAINTSVAKGIACFNSINGSELDFPVKLKSGSVNRIFQNGDNTYLGGTFEMSNGKRNFLAVSMNTGVPTVQAGNISFTEVKPSRLTLYFPRGNGSKYLVLGRMGSAVDTFPTNGIGYTGNTLFGSGQNIGSCFVISAGADTSITVTGLNPGTAYHFAVFAYNGFSTFSNYMTSSPPKASQTTTIGYNVPSVAASGLTFSNVRLTSLTLKWTKGNGEGRYVIAREATAVNKIPNDSINYFSNNAFGSGDDLGSGNFLVYNGTADSVSLTGLKSGVTYHFAVHEYNGDPLLRRVMSSAGTGSTATLSLASEPGTAAASLSFSNITITSMQVSWTSGNGSSRIVIASKGEAVASAPSDGETYFSDNTFNGSSSYLSANERVVYVGNGNSFNLSGLDPATTYYFTVVEYNGSGLTTNYKATGNPTASQATATDLVYPTTASKDIVFTKIGQDTLSLSWTSGNGAGRLVIIKKGDAVSALPYNSTVYNANSKYGLGDSLEDGSYVVMAKDANTLTVTGLSPKTPYHFAVIEYNQSPIGPLYLSDSVTRANTTTLNPIGMQSIRKGMPVKVFPNPVINGQVTLSFDKPLQAGARISVFDLQGKLMMDQYVETSAQTSYQIFTEEWSQGDYLVTILSGNERMQTRFRIQ